MSESPAHIPLASFPMTAKELELALNLTCDDGGMWSLSNAPNNLRKHLKSANKLNNQKQGMYMQTKEFDWPFEISGFGGTYEQACRDMTKAGALWLRTHPEELSNWRKHRAENPPSKSLEWKPRYLPSYEEFEKAIIDACPDSTGAMFGAAKSHAIAIYELGWDRYVAKVMAARDKKEAKSED